MIGSGKGSWPGKGWQFWVVGDSTKVCVECEAIAIWGSWIWPKHPERHRYKYQSKIARPLFHCDSRIGVIKLDFEYLDFMLQSNPAKLHSSMKSSSWCPMAILCTCENVPTSDFSQLSHFRELHVQGEKLLLSHQSRFLSFPFHFWAASQVGYWSQ